ncbi:quinol:electron acceptor oxidoreductase subunit ActD [Geothrix sp. 21YS21S-4]|uniref:quinol:electron acceptor oxidoreductase subunit ActD n=1 Tax=Geothrix sp. 21YS21S-4 TaxID=3068889 RepID=UPI0027BB1627|nr:quinol:electron acceptor oxidoreductase subunit ActD [Geothrix sp. 21YS21S-4]
MPETPLTPGRSYAVLGVFATPDALMTAIPKVRGGGLGTVEAYTPYAIHGIDDALGLRRSPLGGMVLVMGVLGALTAFGFQYWISAIDYPIVTGGKPPDSWEAFIPIMFEVTVLFATFTAGLGMLLLLNKLPFFGHPMLSSRAIKGITRDRYVLALEAENDFFDSAAAAQALREAGAADVEILPAPDRSPFLTSDYILRVGGGILIACTVAGLAIFTAIKWFPLLPPMKHMQEQPRLNAQKPSVFFKDGHGMQRPVAGTVARGHLPTAAGTQEEAASLVNPLPRTKEVFAAGRQAYKNRCEVCHGPVADGQGSLTAAYGGKPANLQSQQFRDYPDGKIYWTIVNGKNAMPSHAAELGETQRWAVVHYVRALQRAQNAKDEDLKVGAR